MIKVASLEQLQEYKKGEVVELEGWTEEPFICRLRKVSLLDLSSSGTIPNNLLNAAHRLFVGKVNGEVDMGEIKKVMDIICEHALIEPSLDLVKKAGLSLTDVQRTDIYNYSQKGVRAMSTFRTVEQSNEDHNDVSTIQDETKLDPGNG